VSWDKASSHSPPWKPTGEILRTPGLLAEISFFAAKYLPEVLDTQKIAIAPIDGMTPIDPNFRMGKTVLLLKNALF
jgi:hypothetical protein